ncbi:MAG: acyl-CoA thioesterase [Planctomycetota bacterium]
MPNALKPPSSEPAIRVVMMPRDTNAEGTIFGGVILSLIDQAAYVEAVRQAHHCYVTVAMHEVKFHQPVFVGDVLSLYAEATRLGRTSMTIKVRVCARRRHDPDQQINVTEAEVVFVAVTDGGKPKPIVND